MESTDNTQHFYKSNTGFDLPVLRSTSSSSSHLFPKCFIFVRFFFPPPFSRAILKENENKQRVKREVNENGGKISLHAVFHPTNCRAQHNQRDCLQPPGCVCWYLVMNHSLSPASPLHNTEGSSNVGTTPPRCAHHCHSHHKGRQKITKNAASVCNVLFRHRQKNRRNEKKKF